MADETTERDEPVVEIPDDAIEALVKAASGIDIVPELLARVPEAVEYVNAWRKTLIDNGSLREESPTNEFLGVLTIAATWIEDGSIAARVRAKAVADEQRRITEVIGDMCTYRERDGSALPHPHPADHLGPCPYGQAVQRILAAGSVPVATPPMTEHERQHREYGTWPCAFHGDERCLIMEGLRGPVATPPRPERYDQCDTPESEHMTDTELDLIEKRLAATTPGEWMQGLYIFDGTAFVVFSDGLAVAVTERSPHPSINFDHHHEYRNATFIAHAKADIQVLLKEVRGCSCRGTTTKATKGGQ